MQEIKPLLRSRVSDKDLIIAVSKTAAFEKERNLVLGKEGQLNVDILQLRAKFQTAMVSCSRSIWITDFSDHRTV